MGSDIEEERQRDSALAEQMRSSLGKYLVFYFFSCLFGIVCFVFAIWSLVVQKNGDWTHNTALLIGGAFMAGIAPIAFYKDTQGIREFYRDGGPSWLFR